MKLSPGSWEQRDMLSTCHIPCTAALQALNRGRSGCAGEKPRVRLIPGSWEQRGTDFRRALRGEAPFCRFADLLDLSFARLHNYCKRME